MISSKKNSLPIVLTGFTLILMVCNLHLFHGSYPSMLIFEKGLVAGGEWWRVITHLFVHVSWYHLLLDGGAVAFLWHEIDLDSLIKKFLVAVASTAGSLLAAIWFSPHIEQFGYCGLSGLAHGLMFFLGLVWLSQSFLARRQDNAVLGRLVAGSLFVLLSGGKSIVEVVSGSVIFSQLHLGNLGIPIVHAHLGGVLGGFVAFVLLILVDARKVCSQKTKILIVDS